MDVLIGDVWECTAVQERNSDDVLGREIGLTYIVQEKWMKFPSRRPRRRFSRSVFDSSRLIFKRCDFCAVW